MYRTSLLTVLFLGSIWTANAQTTHKEAKALLNKAAQKLQSEKLFTIEFEYLFENPKSNPPVKQTEKGKLLLKGNKYHLYFMDMEQIFDGTKVYNILTDDKEIQVMEPDENDIISPSAILNQYREGHTYYLGGKVKINNIPHEVVVIKPKASADVDYMEVVINPQNYQLHSLMQRGRDGSTTTFRILRLTENTSEDTITFAKDKYKGFKIIQ